MKCLGHSLVDLEEITFLLVIVVYLEFLSFSLPFYFSFDVVTGV